MKDYKRKNIKIIVSVVCIISIVVFSQTIWSKHYISQEQNLSDAWSISIDDVSCGQHELSEYRFSNLKKGNKVTISQLLKPNEINGKTLRFTVRYSYVQVYLNQELVYESGESHHKDGTVVGHGYCWATLPNVNESKTLTIVYDTCEEQAFSSLGDIVLVDTEYIYLNFINKNMVNALLIAFMFVFGLSLVVAAFLMEQYEQINRKFMIIGILSFEFALWMACNTKLIEIITRNLQVICYIEYIAMYASITTMIFLMSFFVEEERKTNRYLFLGYIFLLLDIVLIVLNVTNLAHFPRSVNFYHGISIMVFLFLLFRVSHYICRSKKETNRFFMSGIWWVIILAILELIRYRYNRMVTPEHAISQGLVPIGVIIFTSFVLAGFIHQVVERVEENTEQKTLIKMAYTDALTGISNRAQCEKIISQYEKNKQPITIINMDLNKFKEINDQYGHTVGDEVLKKFASILSDYFIGVQCIARMGGDEFLVIMNYKQDEEVEANLRMFEKYVQKENEKAEHKYHIHVACGYASDKEGTNSPWEIYAKADKNMYRVKNRR